MVGTKSASDAAPQQRPSARRSPKTGQSPTIAGVHPALAELVANQVYERGNLCDLNLAGLELLLRIRPVGITPPDVQGISHVVTGVRSWQVYAAARARRLVNIRALPYVVVEEARDDVRIRELGVADLLLSGDYYALDSQTVASQRIHLQQLLAPERLAELISASTPDVPSLKRARRGKGKPAGGGQGSPEDGGPA